MTRGLKVLLLSYGEYGRDTLTLDGHGAGTWRSLTSDKTAYALKGATGNAVGTYSFEYSKSYRTDTPNAYALDARYFGGENCRFVIVFKLCGFVFVFALGYKLIVLLILIIKCVSCAFELL